MAVNKKDMAAGLASAVALISGAQVAYAADAEPALDVQDWSGFYIGGAVGVPFGDAPVQQDNDYKLDGDIVFGGFAGVNQQYGNLVVGAELGLQTGGEIEGDDEDYNLHYTADAKLKVGTVLGAEDQLLVYGFGGFFASTFEAGSDNHDYAAYGVNYGLGADWMVTEQFSLGAEVIGRSVLNTYESDDDGLPDASYQASLRAAFHF